LKDAGWTVVQLTSGTAERRYHSHSYYDIPVLDSAGRWLVGYQVGFAGRRPSAGDAVEVGILDLDGGRQWTPVGESRAWSWQQGPMAQWVPGSRRLVWNDRNSSGRFVGRSLDVDTGSKGVLPRPVYALDPAGGTAFSLNFARLEAVRPGYGYAGGSDPSLDEAAPRDDGIWKLDLASGADRLILSLHDAVRVMRRHFGLSDRVRHMLSRYRYWFNHIKISPDGRRFTVKLRFRGRRPGSPWSDAQGVSLSCGVDGSDCRVVARGTSHVIWLGPKQLYLWQRDGVYLYRDATNGWTRDRQLGPGIILQNAHLRHIPSDPLRFVFDTPYRREIDLFIFDEPANAATRIARFRNHVPDNGEFRCDLHPVPSPSGDRVVVTSLQDGGRQLYLVARR
jgi:hypothetical protein